VDISLGSRGVAMSPAHACSLPPVRYLWEVSIITWSIFTYP